MREPLLTVCVSIALLVPATAATAAGTAAAAAGAGTSAAGSPWGPPRLLYGGHAAETISQATTSSGTTVATFRALPRHDPAETMVAIQVSGEPWGAPTPLSTGPALRPTVIAWGAGHLSVIFQSPAGQDNYLFHERALRPDGTLGRARKLFTAQFAYPSYQAAVNSDGTIALAWSNGDLFDRVVTVQRDGTTNELPPVPVHHPTSDGLQFIANPKRLFLDDSGRVSDLTWGTLHGSDRAVWLMRPDGLGGWHSQRVAPLQGGVLAYGYVDEADYAMNPAGDLAVSWQQRDPATKEWSTEFRFAPAGGKLGASRTLADEYCFIDNPLPCAGLAMAPDGTATVAYGVDEGGTTMTVQVVRRSADGTFTKPQQVSDTIWVNSYDGVQVAGNRHGDALVSFTGGNHQRFWTQFARCPSDQPCEDTLLRSSGPSWLDPWVTSMGPRGATVTWSHYYHQGVLSRHLAP